MPRANPSTIFSYVDQIYDGLLENKVRPFVELAFMPKKLGFPIRTRCIHFWYKQNVAPPKDWSKWDQFIEAFSRHLVQRYGEEEVANWYFEVWNEPNLDFWSVTPRKRPTTELYDHTARAIKRVSARFEWAGRRPRRPLGSTASWPTAKKKMCP